MASRTRKSHKDVEFAVNDASGQERIFRTFPEACAFEVKGSGLPLRHDTFGTHPVARPRGLKDAKRLAEDIYEAAFQLGIDANAGERFKP